MNIFKYWKTIVIAVMILYGSITSSNNLNKIHLFQIPYMDKIIHLSLYFVLTISLQSSLLRCNNINNSNRIVLTTISVISYGLLMEVLQYYLTNTRSAEIFDVLANITGCLLGIFIMPIILKYKLNRFL